MEAYVVIHFDEHLNGFNQGVYSSYEKAYDVLVQDIVAKYFRGSEDSWTIQHWIVDDVKPVHYTSTVFSIWGDYEHDPQTLYEKATGHLPPFLD